MSENDFDAFFDALKQGDLLALRGLITAGKNVNATNRFGWTPLMCTRGNTASMSVLLEAGASVNVVNQFGESPLACAAHEGHLEAVKLLLKYGASVDVEPHGCSLLTYVMTGSGRDHPKIIKMLQAAGATEFRGNA